MIYKNFDSIFESSLAEWSTLHRLDHTQSSERELFYIKSHYSRLKNFTSSMYASILSQPSSIHGFSVVSKKETVLTARYFHFAFKGFFDLLTRKFFHDVILSDFHSPPNPIEFSSESNLLRRNFLDLGYSVCKGLFDPLQIDTFISTIFNRNLSFLHGLTGKTISSSKLYSIVCQHNLNPSTEFSIPSGRWTAKLISKEEHNCDELTTLLNPLSTNKYHQVFMPYLSTPLLVDARLHISLPMPTSERTNQQNLDSQALMWHSDWHGSSFMKAFIPLTPFSSEHGSHAFLSGSHLQKPYYYADMRYKDDVIMSSNATNVKQFSLIPGDCLFEDTSGIHKGIPGLHKTRMLVILLFQNNMIYDHDWNLRHPIML